MSKMRAVQVPRSVLDHTKLRLKPVRGKAEAVEHRLRPGGAGSPGRKPSEVQLTIKSHPAAVSPKRGSSRASVRRRAPGNRGPSFAAKAANLPAVRLTMYSRRKRSS